MSTVLITGARGFIASRASRLLAAEGYRVLGTSRKAGLLPGYEQVYPCSLGDPLWSLLTGEKVDAVIHTALDPGHDSFARNVSGTTRWLQEARQAGVTTQVLLSSLSAAPDASSDYGRSKWALEQKFIEAGQVVFRLGVVAGRGGMFGRMVESATRYPIVPMLDGGSQLVYLLGVETLACILRDTVQSGGGALRGRSWNLQQPEPFTLREVIRSILAARARRPAFVKLPARPLVSILTLWEKQRWLRLPITSTNVKGLIQAGRQEFPSDFGRFGYAAEPLDDLVTRALAD